MMNSLKIRQKFFILGIIAFLSLLCLGTLTFNINKQGFINLSQVFTDFEKVQNVQSTYIEPLFSLREKNLTLVMSPNKHFKSIANKNLLQTLEILDNNFIYVEQDIYDQWINYKNLLLRTRAYTLKGFDEGAFMNAISAERDQFYSLIEALKLLQIKRLNASKTTFLEAKKDTNNSKYYIIFSFLFVGISSFIFDMYVIRKIIESIEQVTIGLTQFFSYLSNPKEASKNIKINLETKDELGIMAKAINEQVSCVKEAITNDYKLIEEATATLKGLKDGVFGKRLTCKASSIEINTLKQVMNNMIDNLENKVQEEINKRSSQEKLLVHQSKLAAIGNMLENIAHQWRQPISEINAILMKIEAITRYSILKKEDLLNNIVICCNITEEMSATISDFQNFFKPSKKKEHFCVNEVCNNAISILSASFKFHHIDLSFCIDKNAETYGYPREFSHAILNILSNAKDVLIERKIKEPTVSLRIKTGKKYIIIQVEDNGRGIKIENIDSIFEPYFSTKHSKQGIGIGLYMTKMIIEDNMNGFINAENSRNGALFTIKIERTPIN